MENLVAQRFGDDYPVLGTRREVPDFREDSLLNSRGVWRPEVAILVRLVTWDVFSGSSQTMVE